MTLRISDAIGRRVVARDSAEEIGKLKALLFAQPPVRVTGAWVTGSKRNAQIADWDHARFGPDAILVDSESSLRDADDEQEDRTVHRDRVLLGARVLDVNGFEHGKVTDAEVDEDDGSIIAVSVGERRVDPRSIRSLGTYALVVDSPPA